MRVRKEGRGVEERGSYPASPTPRTNSVASAIPLIEPVPVRFHHQPTRPGRDTHGEIQLAGNAPQHRPAQPGRLEGKGKPARRQEVARGAGRDRR